MAVVLTKENFEQEVLKADKPVLVDFWAEWCGPCQMMLPVIEELAKEQTEIKVCKVNVDEQMELARQYRVMSIPTFLVFKNGEIIAQTLGALYLRRCALKYPPALQCPFRCRKRFWQRVSAGYGERPCPALPRRLCTALSSAPIWLSDPEVFRAP